jgi:glycosyltransferase involved in cell wall biosynthesis
MKLSVSVVLCTYNGEKFIREQIKTIVNQSYPILELLVVDDASIDKTYEIVESIAKSDPRIKLFQNAINLGFTSNFEKAIKLADGECIAIADQDDIWELTKLEQLMQNWRSEVALIYCDSVRFKDCIPNSPLPNRKNRRIEGANPIKLAMFNTVSGHASIIHKSLLIKAIPFPKNVYYDWWLAVIAMLNGGVQFYPKILVYQRIHEQNVTIQLSLTEKKLRHNYRHMLNFHLQSFSNITQLSNEQRQFFIRFQKLWQNSLNQKINLQLFLFLLRYHRSLFYYKVRSVPFISAFKVSFLFSFRFKD